MSAVEELIKSKETFKPKTAPLLNRMLDFLSSVRFGVVLLCVMVVLAMAGMIVLQQNVSGFDAYYVSLTPAEKTVFGALGIFDIYHTWYFNALLLVLSLNIVLASIDHFPAAWSYIAKPKKTATTPWLLARKSHDSFEIEASSDQNAVEKVSKAIAASGLKTSVVENDAGTYVFGQAGQFNRIGAYIVHVFLLTLFLGHFVALQTGFDADVRMAPGERTDQIQMIQFDLDKKEKFNVKLPFTMECTDISQTLIDPTGNIDVSNTLDWATKIRIDDPSYGVVNENVSLNRPLNYRGYRFFQAQTIPVGNARTIKLELTSAAGGDPIELSVERNGSASLPDGTKVDYEQFLPDFTFGKDGKPDTKSGEYNNPAAVLGVTSPNGVKTRVFAFAQKLPDSAPVGAPKLGYKWHLAEFEKSPLAHILSIKYDPFGAAFIAWYIGGFGLIGALCFVFFFSHRRVWALISKSSEGRYEVVMAGEANRNQFGFQDKFNQIARSLHGAKG
ncbi:MAG: cytochrome c biogenesis protein ResB [Acidobacteriota bacterium]